MKALRLGCVLLAAMPLSFAASREIVELQRDMSNLQDQVRKLQQTLDQLQGAIQQSIQQSNETARQSAAALAVMQSNVNDAIKRQQESVTGPVVAVGTKLDQMAEDFRNMKETVLDVGTRVGKLDQKVTDLQNAVTVIRTPPAAPPSVTTPGVPEGGVPPTAGAAGAAAPSSPPAGMSADTLYSNATRDYMGGSYDLALQEYGDYVRWYSSTQFAPNAQFFIGDIYFRKKDYDNALQSFDAVLEHWSENSKTAAAHYMKGKTLVAQGKHDAAAKEFREVLSKYPNSDVAPKSKAELADLGLAPRTGAATRSSRSRRK